MPTLVRLLTEHGEMVKELACPPGVIEALQPPLDDPTSICWRFIDWYGDTYFINLQMKPFIEELDRLTSNCSDTMTLAFAKELRTLAEECQSSGLFLMFYGD
jgi:hypothetical protein